MVKNKTAKPKPFRNQQRLGLIIVLVAFIGLMGLNALALHSLYTPAGLASFLEEKPQLTGLFGNPKAFWAQVRAVLPAEDQPEGCLNQDLTYSSPGTQKCVGAWIYRCDSDHWWRPVQNCSPGTCENAACKNAPEKQCWDSQRSKYANPGAKTCNNVNDNERYLLTCKSDGTWLSSNCYPHICQLEGDSGALCKAGTKACFEDNNTYIDGQKFCKTVNNETWAYICNNGTSTQVQKCSQGCADGNCLSEEMMCYDDARGTLVEVGTVTCGGGGKLYTCSRNGVWTEVADGDCAQQGKICKIVSESSAKCQAPPTTVCADPSRGTQVMAGTKTCDQNKIKICASSGKWEAVEGGDCAQQNKTCKTVGEDNAECRGKTTQKCVDAARDNTQVAAGTKTCIDKEIQICLSDGSWSPEVNGDCASMGQQCALEGASGAKCELGEDLGYCFDPARSRSVTSGTQSCKYSTRSIQVCGADGYFRDGEICGPAPGECKLNDEGGKLDAICVNAPEQACKDIADKEYKEGEKWCEYSYTSWAIYTCSGGKKQFSQRCPDDQGCQNGACAARPEVLGEVSCQDKSTGDPCGTSGICQKYQFLNNVFYWCAEPCASSSEFRCAAAPYSNAQHQYVVACQDVNGKLRWQPHLLCDYQDKKICSDGYSICLPVVNLSDSESAEYICEAIAYIQAQVPVTIEQVQNSNLPEEKKQEYIKVLGEALAKANEMAGKYNCPAATSQIPRAGGLVQAIESLKALRAFIVGGIVGAASSEVTNDTSIITAAINDVNNIATSVNAPQTANLPGYTGFITATAAVSKTYGIVFTNPLKAKDVPTLIKSIANYLLTITGTIMVIVLIWNGIRYMTAGGDERRAESAKKAIKWALIGVVVILVSGILINGIIAALRGDISPP